MSINPLGSYWHILLSENAILRKIAIFINHEFIPISYSAFWNVPSSFITQYKSDVYLFFRDDFDEALDDYPPNYEVYICNDTAFEDAVRKDCWTPECFKNRTFIGEIATERVIFDWTKRKAVNTAVFEMIEPPASEQLAESL